MTMTLPVISNLVHCKGISTREQLYFRGRGGFVEFGKFQGLTLCFHDQTMKRSNFGKINQNVLSLSTRSMQMELKRNAIVFGKRSSVEVVDGWEENKELLEDHLNSLRHAITMDNPEAAIGVMDKLGSLPLNDELKESARDINELEDQLHELFIQVQQIIETGDEGTARELIDANYESVAEQLEIGIKGVEQAAMLDILAQLHMSLSDFKATKNLLEQIKKILAGVGNHEPLVDKILEHMGTMYTALEEPKEALPLYTRSLGIQEAVLGKNNPLLVNLLLSLANTYNAVDEGHKSIQLYHRAITILERRKGSESEDLVFPLTHLSHVLIEEGEFDEAENSLHRALGIMEKLHGENDGRVGAVTCVLARALCANGKVDDAVVLYEKGLQIMERNGNLSLDDPVLETTRTDLAELLHVLGREEESQLLWEKNLLIKEEALGRDHPSLALHLQNLATSYALSRKFEKSEYILRRSLRILSAGLVPNAPEISFPMLSLATTLYHLGRHREAEDLAQEALRIREASFDKQSPAVGEACDCLALIQHALGKDDEAEPLMWRVLQIQEKEFGYDSPEVMSTLEMLIVFLGNLGKETEKSLLRRRLMKLQKKYKD